jgi:hypothetical protein
VGRRFRRPTGGLAVLVAGAALLAGCGHDESGAPLAFDRNQRLYALPLDQFAFADIGASDYAGNLLVQSCMRKRGYDWPIPAYDPHAARSATWNSAGRRLFDAEIARTYGYHLAPSGQSSDAEAIRLNSRQLTAGESAAKDACIARVRRTLPAPDSDLVGSLASAAYEAAKADDATLASAARWHDCMAPVGISDLPDVPSRMPSPSLGRRFGLDSGMAGSPSPKEVRIATADARCRDSSGYAKTMYDAEVDQQLTLIGRNRPALDRARATNAQVARRVKETIVRFGSR